MLHGPIWSKLPQYALPVAATGILEQLFNASDLAIVGNFTGANKTIAVAAVGANTSVIGLILNLFIGIALGVNVVIANAIGKKDHEMIKKSVHTAIFRSVGNSKVSMILSVLMNAINIVLNAVLVMMGYGVLGVALATLVSRIVCGICMVILVTKPYNPLQLKRLRELLPNRKMITRILRIGIPSGIENSMFQVGKLMVVSMITKFGTAAIAANSVSYSVIEFPNIPGMSMGLALITVVGNCLGAGEIEQAKKYTKKLMVLAYAGDWIMNALLFVFAPQVVGVFSLSKEATDMAVEVLRWFSSVAVFIWPLSFTLPNALRAAGDVKYTMLTGILSMWMFRVLCSYFLAVVCNLGILGVWYGMFIDWGVRSLFFVIRYLSGKWQTKKVIS